MDLIELVNEYLKFCDSWEKKCNKNGYRVKAKSSFIFKDINEQAAIEYNTKITWRNNPKEK